MPKGPFGAPRPLSEYRIIVDPHKAEVSILKVGPFGGPRPLAKNNPPIEDAEVAECMLSDAGTSFGAGVRSRGETTNIEDLSPAARQEALEMTEKWCRGSKEAQAIEGMEEEEALPTLTRVRRTLANETGTRDQVDIEMVGTPEEIEAEVVEDVP